MKLPGIISKRFREKQECDLCGKLSTWKAKCWDEEDLGDVCYACKKCHDAWSCCGCRRPKGSWMKIGEEW